MIAGPTGSGKTDLGVELALRLGAPVISADSRQVFRGLRIGTAQPDAGQLRAVRHYFIADRDITDDYNAGIFEKEALVLLDGLFEKYPYVLAVGGSGLYIDALCEGFDNLPLADPEIRRALERRLNEHGLASLTDELRELDPAYCSRADLANPVRVMRALEVCISSGRPYSEQRRGEKTDRSFGIVKIGIDTPRMELYDRINRRVDMMVLAGLEREARELLPYRHLNALQTVGYREMFDYFDGLVTREYAVELLKRNSRRYAKRQMTWFRRDPGISWFGRKDVDPIENFIKKFAG